MEDDEDVVFENSALYEHLQHVGYNADDIKAEQHRSSCQTTQDHLKKESELASDEMCRKNARMFDQIKHYLFGYIFDEAWHSQVRHLCMKNTRHIVDEVLKTPIFCEEDAAYVESFASSLSFDRPDDSGDGILGQMLTQMGVLAVTMAYGFFRMFYMKLPEFAMGAYVYVLDVLSIIMTIVALAPAALKFATIGRLVGQLQVFSDGAIALVRTIGEFERLSTRTIMFLQEMEVIKRGFTLVTAPVCRLELGTLGGRQHRHCPDLRRTLFHCLRNVMLEVKDVTSHLLKHLTSEDPSNYLASLPLDDYGPSISLADSQSDALCDATDDFCLASLKAVAELTSAHVSEFLRVLCVLCLVRAETSNDNSRTTGFSDSLKRIQRVTATLHENCQPIERSFVLHRSLETRLETIDSRSKSRSSLAPKSGCKPVYTAVHSLRLHLHAAINRIQSIDDEVENIVDSENDDLLTTDVQSRLVSVLESTRRDLTSCGDCWDEASRQLAKLRGIATIDESSDSDRVTVETSSDVTSSEPPLIVIPNHEPVAEDQVFEGYPEQSETETKHVPVVLAEEQKRDQQESMRLLSELRTVIAVRAKQTIERERSALLRQNPDYKFDDDDDARRLSNPPSETRAVLRPPKYAFESDDPDTVSDFLPSSGCMFTKEIAKLAVAKSQHLPALSVDTFGDASDDDGDGESDNDSSNSAGNPNVDNNDYEDYDDDGDSNCPDD